ncbi:LIM and calponin homology domains-containing protein 1-like isoform X2 [Gouania willdenowi]|uniref:LIM and calponin homology domains-containing protein 1-like isoform X2 n=1 Tax=Gouania willdenowi TaxID=441366 RepID=UPI0010566765|nr:LIM and calponin homology domains-containing protein 1-like isoform X2 [Gouania willdenowi]
MANTTAACGGLKEHHPEPACQEAQKWIEAVTGKNFADKDFRSALENGILLCELLSAIKPGLVKKINRLPTPIAGLDNLSVFLRGCEELGLKGAQLFDPGDLQDTSIRANLKDSDCNRKLKNVLNTIFWLGKAASGCASYSGPTLNLKEFEALLAQMKIESDDGGESPQKGSVRDSGYDCWDSERSESLSPPQHTRDNSLDSLDSFGSRSQHSSSPDVVNRGNSDGRGSDSEADGKRPDLRKDDMLARRTGSIESKSTIPFNQFLPNRSNMSSYVPAPRRKPHSEEGEQRSHCQAAPEQSKRNGIHHKTLKTVTWAPENNEETLTGKEEMVNQGVSERRKLQKLEKAGIKVLPAAIRYCSPPTVEEKEERSVSPNIILRCDNDFLSSHKSAWDSPPDGEEDTDVRKVPDVHKDDLASRRASRGPVGPKVHQFVPPPVCTNKDLERWEGIRRASQQTLQEKETREMGAVPDIITRRNNPFLKPASRLEEEEEDEEEEGKIQAMPHKQRDDLARRRAQSRSLPQRDGPMSLVSSAMSQSDMQKWERLKMTEPSENSTAPVCPACQQKSYGRPFNGSVNAGRGQGKVVTFGGVTEIEQPIDAVTSSEGEETELLRRLLSKATVAMPTIGLGSRFSERERSHLDGADSKQTIPTYAGLPTMTTECTPSPAEVDARLAQYVQRTEEWGEGHEEEEEEEERMPDLKKDDMMARRTGVFHKQSVATAVTYNRFLPLPASKHCTRGEVTADAAPRNKQKVFADRSKKLDVRVERQQPGVPMEMPERVSVLRATSEDNKDELDENEPVPDLEKDDMMARRTRSKQKEGRPNQFLPVPGSVKFTVSPVSAMKLPHSRPKTTEKVDSDSVVSVAAELQATSSKAPNGPTCLKERRMRQDEKSDLEISNVVSEPLTSPSRTPEFSPATAKEAELEKQRVEEKVEVEQGKRDDNMKPYMKPLGLEDDELPPMMMSRRVAFMPEEAESVSMSDMLSEDEVGHLPSMNRYDRMHEQYNSFREDDDHWQDELARWKNRRRSASQELIKKEEERKRIEKRMKEDEKRKSIKTYKEILEEKERREAELCEAYRNAATPEMAALVLQRYALRFTISDATLDSLKLPRSTSAPTEHTSTMDSDMADQQNLPNATTEPEHKKQKEMETETANQREASALLSASAPTLDCVLTTLTDLQNVSPRSLQLHEPLNKPSESPPTHPEAMIRRDAQPQTKHTPPQTGPEQPHPAPPTRTLPPAPSVTHRPVPLLAAKPYQPRGSLSAVKPVKMDGLVRVNGETTEDFTPAPPTCLKDSTVETKHVPSEPIENLVPPEEVVQNVSEAAAEQPPPQPEKPAPSPVSTISSLLGGRNCITKTTIVTELTQTHVEAFYPDMQTNGQVEANMEAEEACEAAASPSSTEDYSPSVTEGMEESSMSEQYQKEQEKLKMEWEKAQLEVKEEERKHNEEERRILEETVSPLSPVGWVNQQTEQTSTTSPSTENNTNGGNVPRLHNGQKMPIGNGDQHSSKLHFFQDPAGDSQPLKKQEMWKTASLDRNPHLNPSQVVKRSGSHDGVTSKPQSVPSTPQPPSPTRCVSGKRLCSGCSQPLGKGAAMIIDTLGLFFHIQCFKCGVCHGQLGDASAGTDVRIRNGLLSCHECYIASRGRGQPTTL